MEQKYLGIDLGTSAVKLLLVTPAGSCKRAKCRYAHADISGWCEALKSAVAMLKEQDSLENLCGISLSSQVGTYITDTGEILSWQSSAGSEELRELQSMLTQDQWVQHIGMTHPALNSYPLPRLLYLKRHCPQCKAVMMPKELLLQELTGNTVTDVFSWRGLCHPDRQAYAQALLDQFDIRISLPPLAQPTDRAGSITATAAEKYGLPEGAPVYVGCNDFYAGLLGMGVVDDESVFELSGTSEHLGLITAQRIPDAPVSGRYFNGFVTYGGTKSSGASCELAINMFGIEGVEANMANRKAPIFLPYLNGERAPIYDENAKGVFFGLSGNTTSQDMAYAVLEGVVFSLYHIGTSLQLQGISRLIMGGGSAANPMMARLKAALFDCPVLRVVENDSSALGAAMLAMVGDGVFASVQAAAIALVHYETAALPDPQLKAQLCGRYAIFEKLYEKLKDSFADFAKLKGEHI